MSPHDLHEILTIIVEYGALAFELVGVLVLLYAGFQGCMHCFKHKPHATIEMGHGMSLALKFMMGGEILKTVTATSFEGCALILFLIILRVALTLVLHWEIQQEEKDEEKHAKHEAH